MSRRATEIPMLLFSALACLLFLTGLVDTPRSALQWMQAPAPPVDRSERDAGLRVTVRAKGGPVLPGATVQLFWESQRTFYWAGAELTDSDGSARLGQLPRGSLEVLVDAKGYARLSKRIVLARGEQSLEVELGPEHSLRVRVSDEEGAPLSGATVLVTSRDPLPFGALTDAKGEVSVGRLPDGPWTAKVSAPGYESIEQAGASGLVDVSLRRLGSLLVVVEDPEGKPAGGAMVAIAGSSLWPARRTETDESGTARIAGLLAGAYDLQATHGNLVSDPMIGLELERGANQSVTLKLKQGRMVTAVVTDGEGPSPIVVPNAEVV
ncbi:MAG TPA: carboxypeptidase-like regulatory domain-containing protein, partial [Polyangiaceae bacterium]|nr:carboxypeptidase-like regulatory domain-containing protein [Polyangiaceae bacterium]